MATYTKNYNFVKPELTDDADIRVINENFDKLDNIVFTSGDVANHIGNPKAHSDIFAKYLPLAGGNMTGTLDTTASTLTNLGYTKFNSNVYQTSGVYRFSDEMTGTIQNGYGKQYGARVKLYSPASTYNPSCVELTSISKDDTTKSTKLLVNHDGVTITRGTGNSNKWDLRVPKFSAQYVTQYDYNKTDFISSYYGNCTIGFVDQNKSSGACAQIKVFDNVVKVTGDGVYYNDLQSLFIQDYSTLTETLTGNWGLASGVTCKSTCIKYSNGTMVVMYHMYKKTTTEYGNLYWTFPVPFLSEDIYIASESIYMTDDLNGTVVGYEDLIIKPSTTGAKFYLGTHCDVSGIIRGRWK